MPRKNKYVSLWAGNATAAASLDDYLKVGYTEDGELIPSAFANDFGIKSYDEDFREAQFVDTPSRSLPDLLKGFSYDNVIIPKFTDLCGPTLAADANAVIVLYNFEYTERHKQIAEALVTVRYLGTITFD